MLGPCMVTLVGNMALRLLLMKCMVMTRSVTKAMAKRNWELAI